MGDVDGALDYAHGQSSDPASVGLSATGDDVRSGLDRARRPTSRRSSRRRRSAIVPPGIDASANALAARQRLRRQRRLRPHAGRRYERRPDRQRPLLGGPPAIATVQLVHDIGGRSPSTAFEAGDIDYRRRRRYDASWIAYDPTLGPQLRRSDGARRSATTASTPRSRRSTTSASARRSPGPWTGGGSSACRRPATSTPGDRAWSRPGIPGRSDARLPARPRSGRRPGPAGRGRLPGRRGASRRPTCSSGGPEDRAFAAQIQRRARHHDRRRGQGDGVLRPAGAPTRRRSGRWAGSPTTRARTTSSAILLGHRRVEQLRPLVLARVRRGDRRRRSRRRDPAGGPRGLRPGRGDLARRRAGRSRSPTASGWALARRGLLGA